MKKKRTFQLIMIAFCLIISIFGIYFQFFDKKEKGKEKNQEIEEVKEKENVKEKNTNEFDYSNKDLPKTENESDEETYSEGMNIEVYFTNTDILDKSSLPLGAHSKLCESSQRFLRHLGYDDVTELQILEDKFVDDEEEVSFRCSMDGYEEQLEIKFLKGDSKLKFCIVTVEEF